jgi:UDP-2,3-diacylglucosamine hydrolase
MADWLFIADAHLREGDLEGQGRIIRFLEREKRDLGTLVILGDLFEFWFGFEPFAFEGYKPLLDMLKKLVTQGVRIRYMEGNHDFGLGSYFEDTMRAQIVANDSVVELDGRRVYMAHGDLVNREDRFYRIFRCMLRNTLTYWMIRRAGPRASKRVAAFLSSLSTGRRLRERSEKIERIFQKFAMEKMRAGFDIVILAHNHLPQRCSFRIDGKEAYYYNVGDWIVHSSFLRYRPGQGFELGYFRE